MNNTYEKPEINKDAFNCPFCGTYAKMEFLNFSDDEHRIRCKINEIVSSIHYKHYNSIGEKEKIIIEKIKETIYIYAKIVPILSSCHKCKKTAIWVDEKIVYPKPRLTPMPNEDLDDNLKEDYEEASKIVQDSPRGACALLRSVLQKLLINLGEGKNINSAIKNLRDKNEIDEKLLKALDSVRIIGNSAIHPNELDLKDDKDTALALFDIINYIADRMISSKKKIDKIYELLPASAKNALPEIKNQ